MSDGPEAQGIDSEKLLNLDQKVLSFFSDREFDNMNNWKEQMTVKHLMMMGSGGDNQLLSGWGYPVWLSVLDRRE